MKRCSRRGGINRATAILLALIGVMLVVIAIPGWKIFRYRSEKSACVQAMKSAGDGLTIEYLGSWKDRSMEEARDILDEVMPARQDICPSRGTVYLVKDEHGIYQPVCGLHDDDAKLKTRLNASYALELLEGDIEIEKKEIALGIREEKKEDKVIVHSKDEDIVSREVFLNGKKLDCIQVEEDVDLHRGTSLTSGYEGIVAYYTPETDPEVEREKEDTVSYFLYADEDYCAIWHYDEGWTGTAYE